MKAIEKMKKKRKKTATETLKMFEIPKNQNA